MLIGISTPYRKAGLFFKKFAAHYGKESDILVVRAPSMTLNPTLDQATIDQAFAEDPALAAAEWMAQFRSDIEGFVDYEVVRSCVGGHHEMAPLAQNRYHAFTDPSGGSGTDSFTLAISHKEGDRLVIDAVCERKPPFNPETVVDDFAVFLKNYRVTRVIGDRYAGEWPREQFRKRGIGYVCSEKVKSDLYRDLLPLLNSGRIVLPKSDRLINQLTGLERRTARSGRDSIDHAPGGIDDLANVVAGAADLIMMAERNANTGSGVGIYSQFADQINAENEIRQRLEEEMAAAVPPDSADRSKGFRGPEQRVGDLLQLFRERPEEADAVVSDLEDIRVNSGDLFIRRIARQAQREIQAVNHERNMRKELTDG
jgi:hypothetical protein